MQILREQVKQIKVCGVNMKTIITIDRDKCVYIKPSYQCQEQYCEVPENFDDFQEICEKVIDKSKHTFEAHKGFTLIDEYQFRDDGSVWLYYENVDIVRDITILQMWFILKGIFGV